MCVCFSGVGKWKWGNRKTFFRFPRSNAKINCIGNSAANTQILIELLDDINTTDALSIKSYLRGGVGFPAFRQLVAKSLVDGRVASVIWADHPNHIIRLDPGDVPTEKICHAVRERILKMLRVGAIEWSGFTPPICPANVLFPPSKMAKYNVRTYTYEEKGYYLPLHYSSHTHTHVCHTGRVYT